jgi:hypothetical protein
MVFLINNIEICLKGKKKPGFRPAVFLEMVAWVKPEHDEESTRSQHPIALLHLLRIQIHVAAHLLELGAHLRHAVFDGAAHRHADAGRIVQRGRIVPDVLRDLHRAEFRAAHRAEMGDLVRFLRQGLVVEQARGLGVEAEIELVDPAEVEPRARQRVVAQLGGGVALGQIGSMRRDLVGDDAGLDVVAIGQAEMLLRRHITKHRAAEPADHRGADA